MRGGGHGETVFPPRRPLTIVLRVQLHEIRPPRRHQVTKAAILSFGSTNCHGFR